MATQIYFAGSIRGGRQDAELYARIVKQLNDEHGQVLTEHVANIKLNDKGETNDKDVTDEGEIHDRNLKLLDHADVVVAEVTQPSLGVGYEIGRAITMGKRILCLYRQDANPSKKLSAMIRGLHNEDDIIVQDYKEDELGDIFREFFAAEDGIDEDEDGEGDDDDDEEEDEDVGEDEDEEDDADGEEAGDDKD